MEVAMKSLICPVSPLRVNENTARITGFIMATMIGLYAITGSIVFVIAIALDYAIRAFTHMKYSPASWLAAQLVRFMKLPEITIDKAPKMFAARVGFLFALASALLFLSSPIASLVVALTLMGFAVLESLFNLCVGCLVYTFIVFPIFHRKV
jgi:Domain of unknown function (DUF4395)